MDDGPQQLALVWRGRPLELEFQWVGAAESSQPVVVFLHEGLGSISMWRDFPARLCAAHGLRGLVYSRPGYGRSTPRPAGERWAPDFMHLQAYEVLPALLQRLGVARPWLFGHSDGGSIALLYAGRSPVAGVIAVAPHVFVEAVSIASIERAREAYETGDLRQRLARHHADPDSAFRGWNEVWLDPAFRAWDITAELARISCPVLAVQGEDDEYGTLEQVHRLQRCVPQTRSLVLPSCGHSPHRDRPGPVMDAAGGFIREHSGA